MRIATATRYDEAVTQLQVRQRELSETQAQMTSGKRISKPSDDPTGAAKAERAFLARQRIEGEQRLVAASRNALTLSESTLGQATDVLQNAREVLVSAGNGSYGSKEREAQVMQLQEMRKQLLALANQDDGAGGYVFGGQSGHTLPFADTPAGVVFVGTEGAQQLSDSESMPTTLDGQSVWLAAPTGNGVFAAEADAANTGQAWVSSGSVSDPSAVTGSTYALVFANSGTTYTLYQDGSPVATDVPYTSGKAITVDGLSVVVSGQAADGDRFSLSPSTRSLNPFEALDRAIAALSDPAANGGQLAQAVNRGLSELDSVLGQFQSARSSVGAVMNQLDAVDSRNQDRTVWAQTQQANVEDIDMVKAFSDFQNRQTGYQAALQSYALVQRLSLMDYMK